MTLSKTRLEAWLDLVAPGADIPQAKLIAAAAESLFGVAP